MIMDCIEIADENDLNTVAFPTVGCGALKYPVSDVIQCFKDAAAQFPAIKVFELRYKHMLYRFQSKDKHVLAY